MTRLFLSTGNKVKVYYINEVFVDKITGSDVRLEYNQNPLYSFIVCVCSQCTYNICKENEYDNKK